MVGLDVVNDYYDPALKEARLAALDRIAAETGADWRFHRGDIADRRRGRRRLRRPARFDRVIHLAAQAGVRYSLENPLAYVECNVTGFTRILEACRHAQVPHLTFASTSSVYGGNTTMPFTETQGVDHPLQFYAATKRANELMAHAYAHLYRLPCTGLRFFTVYGPWGRPDMAPMLFAGAIAAGRPIRLFNAGPAQPRLHLCRRHRRGGDPRRPTALPCPIPDWDPADPDPATSDAPFRLYNIGNSAPVELADFIAALERGDRPPGDPRAPAAAARRRARHLRRFRPASPAR